MRVTTLLRAVLGLKHTRILGFRFTETALVVAVKPTKRSSFCSTCGGGAARYDHRPRTWRHLDACGLEIELEYAIWRVACPRCGVTTEMVPWADPVSGFTYAFDMSIEIVSSSFARSGPSSRKKLNAVSASLPGAAQTTRPLSWSVTMVMYS